ncbi:DUF1444 family protein [Macrococcus sp. DPC7161]|uniref:DUF1444 family protein n=1 Tax=Macrococcus sp. DPC7161 TaxID=2507060 RepID=UPI00100AA45C|nr:DUF1444 family protein [Macrococcus sp. DPC7161]RXK18281.1 DUF1444 family protein [Macrococcus sp. DPC7161]
MNVFEMRDALIASLDLNVVRYQYDRKEETLRVERLDNQKGLTIKLSPVVAKYKNNPKIVDEVAYYIEASIRAMKAQSVAGIDQKKIMPVIRSTSFKKEAEGKALVITEHTAETNIYYAVDLGDTYRLIDESMLSELKLSKEDIHTIALFNVLRLDMSYKTDTVSGNTFYFFNKNDGYDASKILNKKLLQEFKSQITGEMMVCVPHGDLLLIADIQNETGYDVLAQMMMQFFANGLIPITSLSFQYENDQLTPVFILGKNNAKRDKAAIERIEANRKRFEAEKQNKNQ